MASTHERDLVGTGNNGRYRLGIELSEMGTAYLSQSQFFDVVRQALRQLADNAGEIVNLGVFRVLEVLYLTKNTG
jgi:hypothetical protein